MAKQAIGIGTSANDGTGDPLRTAMDKTNDNFNEVYALFGDGSTLALSGDVSVSAGAVTIANDAVENAMIANDAVDSDQIADGAIDTVHIGNDQVTVDKLADEFTAAQAVSSAASLTLDAAAYDVFTWTAGHSATIDFTNVTLGMVKTLVVTGGGGSYTLTLQNINGSSGTFNKISGTYDDTSSTKNIIQFKFISTSEAWYTISKIAS
ncbi:MAG: hypothetical protein Tp156SUR476192_17 [Prokaryotic dsDNA virus sp.]|nr:MAG: hypothetical protein Tp156SUR476192_17 [Prokaryotic dsDNA virus sp.]|tara:strand:- start:12423 stop:13046 length:624 start_codon:yes stop_codon:yes gene_type:complete